MKGKVAKMTTKKEIPGFVRLISVLNWIAGIILILFSIMAVFFVNSSFYENYAGLVLGRLGGLLAGTLYFAIFLIFAIGVFSILIGRGLRAGKNWARLSQVVLSLIWAVLALPQINVKPIGNTVSLTINLLVAYYLLFNLKVQAVFK